MGDVFATHSCINEQNYKTFAMRTMLKWLQPDTDEPKMTELPA